MASERHPGKPQHAMKHAPPTAPTAYTLIVALFAACLTIAAVLAGKLVTFFGLVFPAGVLAYSITFPVTDIVGELWGRRHAQRAVMGGFVALLMVMLLCQLAVACPAPDFWDGQEAFRRIVGGTPRIIVASLVAYVTSQFHDVWSFHFWRRLTGARHLWLRNNISTVTSQLLDTVIFVLIAFWGVAPVGQIILGQFIVKTAIAVLDTPVVYLAVRVLGPGRAEQSSPAPAE